MKNSELDKFIRLFIDTCILLISNGANSNRTRRNVNRIASVFGYDLEMFFSHSAVILTATHVETGEKQTIVRAIPHYHVNFTVISEVSILSWRVVEQRLSYEEIELELQRIKKVKPYNEILKIFLTSLAVGSLCKIFGGDTAEFFIAFFATTAGFLARKITISKNYNININWFVGAFISVTFVNFFQMMGFEVRSALSACVLWLIPGVPLINGFMDVLEGHIVSGAAKLLMGMVLIFMIAVGFYLSLFIFGYGLRL